MAIVTAPTRTHDQHTRSRGAPRSWRDREGSGLVVLTASVVLLVGLLPLGRLVWMVFGADPARGIELLAATLTAPRTMRALGTTLLLAVSSGAAALGIGLALVIVLGCTNVPGKRIAALVFVLSLIVAPQVAALAFKTLAGPASPLLNAVGFGPALGAANPMLSLGGIIVVLALHHAPLAAVAIAPGLRAIPRETIEAASLDGATSAGIVWRIVLPLLAPYIAAAAALVVVAGLGNFGIPALLGLPVGILTLPTLVYQSLATAGPAALPDAARLALVIIALTAVGIGLAQTLEPRAPAPVHGDQPFAAFWVLRGMKWPMAGLVWAWLAATVLLPFVSLLATALVPTYGVPFNWQTVTLDRFTEVVWRQGVTARALVNSTLFAGGAALLVGVLALPIAYALTRRAQRARWIVLPLIELPYAIPGVVVAIVCILLFLRPLPFVGFSLYATPWIIVIAYVIRFQAVALKPTLAAMSTLGPEPEEAAAVSGARLAARLRHVVLPAILPAASAGAMLVFLLAFNELTVSALLWSAGTETLGVALLSLDDAGLGAEAAAVGVVATLVVTLIVMALDRARDRLPEGVLPWLALTGR